MALIETTYLQLDLRMHMICRALDKANARGELATSLTCGASMKCNTACTSSRRA